jgi:hypothetical protein
LTSLIFRESKFRTLSPFFFLFGNNLKEEMWRRLGRIFQLRGPTTSAQNFGAKAFQSVKQEGLI